MTKITCIQFSQKKKKEPSCDVLKITNHMITSYIDEMLSVNQEGLDATENKIDLYNPVLISAVSRKEDKVMQ